MSSDSSSISDEDSSEPIHPTTAGLMKFMFTSGPVRQDLSKPLELADLMTGDMSRLTARHNNFTNPGLLRSLPTKKLAFGSTQASSQNSDSSSINNSSDIKGTPTADTRGESCDDESDLGVSSENQSML